MTCLVATSKFIAADRRVTDEGGGLWPNQRKVWGNRVLIAAFCGSASTGVQLARLVREGLDDPRKLIDPLADHSGALCLFRSGELWLVGGGEASLLRTPVFTLGSGGDLARGFLGARGKLDKKTVRDSIKFVGTCRTDCGGGCDIVEI